ncbi:Fe-S oxidoreductase [Desulfocucumis palustris]|uniref:Fe-S oxidoreductase n=1 Tax=Desulfocucumis palustris TaxID=1898651 RepID=A0A2L2XB65_9FIRM|nr:radical SAM protein [Desulfocucumis palustris]GBF33438.1 Fe-S oxidoreductase [Desulfocucumis palustris]
MRKILFVIPHAGKDKPVENMQERHIVTPPYGVLSLASYLRDKSTTLIDVSILDLNLYPREKDIMDAAVREKIIEYRPDIMGISVMFNWTCNALKTYSEIARGVDAGIIIICGGVVATNYYGNIVKDNMYIDGVCFAEGEIPLLKLVNAADPYEVMENDPSWFTRKALAKGKKPVASFVENLDELPFIDFTMIDINAYEARLRKRTLNNTDTANSGLTLPIHTSRGCPFNCVFCCTAANHGKKMRYMSPGRVKHEVENMINKYGIKRLAIDDDQFLLDRERAKEILRQIAGFNIAVEVASGLSVAFIDNEVARLLKKAGLEIAYLAIESGSERVLREIIAKPLQVEQIETAVKALRDNGLLIHVNVIIGFPGETEEDRALSLKLMEEMGFEWNYIYIATPMMGSRLYDMCVEKNYIDRSQVFDEAHLYNCVIRAPGIDPDYINKKAYMMNLEVNFVKNYRMRIGDFETAAGYFKNVVDKYPHQAFAHYYLARAYEGMGADGAKIQEHYKKFRELINSSGQWKEYARSFALI